MKGALEHGYFTASPLSTLYAQQTPPVRDLGLAIVVIAIADYRGGDEALHRDAARFLYPETEEMRQHYEWAVSHQDKVKADWLRRELDRARAKWDAQRKPAPGKLRRAKDAKRDRLDDWQLHNWHKVAAGAVSEPAHAAGAERAGEITACL